MAVIAVWSLFLPAGRAWHVQALTRAEFWLNRYQTLIAGLIALAGAWWTVRAMQRQTESVRSDAAERALTRYAVALQTVMQKYQAVRPPDQNEAFEAAHKRLEALIEATEDPTMRAALVDGVFGRDQSMLARFLFFCRAAARARLYGQPARVYENMVWPLYEMLTDGINRRKAMLQTGTRVADLYSLATIDHNEIERAFVEERPPRMD